ncbi:anhydro-N-acetylmuramic acid kinase [Sulfurimonas sp.]|uniref:anhydro-N-acetylmuramic acid kinase n=1 Tax=Sulfurimonas sp. TaxID=2022749 RepID=UPI003568A836
MFRSLYIGVMSGTSLDGIDISLCSISKSRFKVVSSKEYPYDDELKTDILKAIEGEITLKKYGELNHRLGLMYADAIRKFLKDFSLNTSNIKAIGLHGQTLWHEPDSKYPFSLQAGDASLVAKQVGIDVVSDFRSGDIALGGEGAPFAPLFHREIFKDTNKKTAALNLGGIANITILNGGTLGYDIGPANILLDLWVQKNKNKKYDHNSEWAREGKVDFALLSKLLDEPFLSQCAPKSTGRELFGKEWLKKKLEGFSTRAEDVQRTLLEFSVSIIAKEVKKYKIKQLYICGGGAKNEYLVELISQKLDGIDVKTSDKLGVDSNFVEAMAFAYFAYKRVQKKPLELSRITGAKHNGVLGALYAHD